MDYHITKIVGYVVDASSEEEAEQIVRENELENPLAYFSKQVPYQFEDALKAFDRSQVVYVGDTVKLPNKHPWWGRVAEVVAVTEMENDETVLDVVCRQEWFEDAPVNYPRLKSWASSPNDRDREYRQQSGRTVAGLGGVSTAAVRPPRQTHF